MDFNYTNHTHGERLQLWNQHILQFLVFDVLIHCLYLCFGIVGNSVVVYVYLTKLKGKENNRYFIPVLAAVDLTACVFGSVFGITLDTFYVTYPSEHLCKIFWAACMFTTQSSVLLLLVISIQRYLLVCKPHGKQMTLYWKRIALVFVVSVSVILTFPVAIFYGEKHVTNQQLNVTGVQCYIKDEYTNSKILLAYNLSLLLLAVIGTTSFTTLYLFVGKAIYKKEVQKNRKNRLHNTPCCSVTNISASVDNVLNDVKYKTLEYQSTFYIPSPQAEAGNARAYDIDNPDVNDTTLTIRHKLELKQRMRQRIDARRFTWLFMTISIVFILAFTPRLILILFESLDTRFWERVSEFQRLIYVIIYRIYIIYHITNPIIYGFQDTDFKRHFKAIFCAWKKRIGPQNS